MGSAPGVPAALPWRRATEVEGDHQIFGAAHRPDERFFAEPTKGNWLKGLQLGGGGEEKWLPLTNDPPTLHHPSLAMKGMVCNRKTVCPWIMQTQIERKRETGASYGDGGILQSPSPTLPAHRGHTPKGQTSNRKGPLCILKSTEASRSTRTDPLSPAAKPLTSAGRHAVMPWPNTLRGQREESAAWDPGSSP